MTTLKKLIALSLMIACMFMITSCAQNNSDDIDIMNFKKDTEIDRFYKYYNPSPIFFETEEPDDTVKVPESTELNLEERRKVNEIFEKLTNYYGIEKEMPEIKKVSKDVINQGGSSSIEITGKYDDKTGIIYVTSNFEAATLAHEMLHYLSGEGVKYTVEGKGFAVYFNEGVTNYFSTKVYPFTEEYTVYELETHQAQMLATAIGEDELAKAYFSGDVTNIKNDFNSSLQNVYGNEILMDLELTPFDTYVGSLDAYFMFMMFMDEDPETAIEYISLEADTTESMMLLYGIKKGKAEAEKELISKLIQNERVITWSYYTSFPEMICEG